MSTIALDFEGFLLDENNFIVKELSFCDLEKNYHNFWTFQPPYEFSKLTLKQKRQYFWIKNNTHGFTWYSGDLPYSKLFSFLRRLSKRYARIYVKGHEKTRFIERFCKDKCFNIEDLGCPKIDFLPHHNISCGFYHSSPTHCALVKAISFSQYLKYKTDSIGSVSAI